MSETHFFNPYNFVSTPVRNTGDEVLGDHAPLGHSRLVGGTYSGSLVVQMTAETPLIIPSSDVTTTNGHKTKKTRVDQRSSALIPSSSVKGMIRSSYEMITNSRYGVFAGHDARLGMRQATTDALLAIPAVVIQNPDNSFVLRLLFGNKKIRDLQANQEGYLTWATQGNWDKASLAVRVGMNEVQLRQWGRGLLGMVNFTYDEDTMKVIEIRGVTEECDSSFSSGYVHATGVPGSTNGTSGLNKGNERIFFARGPENQIDIPLSEDIATYWRDVIRDSALVNEKVEDKYRPEYIQNKAKHDWDELRKFDTCYARVKRSGDSLSVELVQPVHIGRELHPESPASLLDASLSPATDFSSFSPAERLFGWVTDGKSGREPNQAAYAGHMRFSPVVSLSANAVERLEGGKILAILNSPKPSMARFYAGVRDQLGDVAFKKGIQKKAALYKKGTTLRGRKVYPHHGGFDPNSKSWQSSTKTKTNQTILDWIRPESEFEFSIHFRNVTALELGALLASIETGQGECHRLGGARPLAFGAVSMTIDYARSRVSSQAMQATSWKNCEFPKIVDTSDLEKMKTEFESKVGATSFFKTFKAYIKGYANSEGITVTYPRTERHSQNSEDILRWFQENERSERGNLVNGFPLPALGSSRANALPFLKRPPRNAQQNQGNRGPRR